MDQNLRKRMEIIFSIFLLTALTILLIVSLSFPPRPRLLPMIVNTAGLILVAIQLISSIITPIKKNKVPERLFNWKAIILGFLSMLIFILLTYFFGMIIAAPFLVYGCGRAFGAKSSKNLMIVSAIATLIIYLVFEISLGINLYKGILFI